MKGLRQRDFGLLNDCAIRVADFARQLSLSGLSGNEWGRRVDEDDEKRQCE
jgi:hypothetical protein